MSFNAYTDIHAFRFMREVIKKLEGHIHIKSFQIFADSLTKEVLDGLKGGTVKKMVTVKSEFLWHQIKDKKVNKAKKDNKGA